MNYTFDLGVFAVPDLIVDKYIKTSTESELKVLLYCLRHNKQSLTAGEISRATGISPDSVTSALEFCKKITDTQSTAPAEKTISNFEPSKIAELIKNNKDVEYLFQCAEQLYGKPLTHSQQNTLYVIIEQVGMNPAVALMLLEYCFSVDKTDSRYIKKVAANWVEQGINTVNAAESIIQEINQSRKAAENKNKPTTVNESAQATNSSFDLEEWDKQIMKKYK